MKPYNRYFPRSKESAVKAGFTVDLTDPYNVGEYHMMERALDSLRKDDVEYALVNETEDKAAICIYRKTSAGI